MSASAAVPTAAAGAEREMTAAAALIVLLEQLRSLLARIPTAVYCASPASRVSGSVGEHVRHCLDHVAVVASGAFVDELSYDHRRRGTSLESDPRAAVREINRLVLDLHRFARGGLERRLLVSAVLERGARPQLSRSTLGRELAFVVDHTTHHLAIVALLLDRLGWDTPDGFGLAPSTPKRH